VSYELVKQYNFVPDKSVNLPENDLITMPNIPLFAAGSSMKDANYFTLAGFKAAINMLGEDKAQPIFVRKTVQEVLWGYDDKLTEMGRKFMPSADLKTDQFGLLAGKNMSSDGVYVVYTGSDDLTRLGQIKSFKGQEYYNVWPSPECDKIIGGEGSFNPPMLDMKSKVDIMVGDLCRSIKLIPTKIVQVGQIEALRFVPDPDLFNYEAEQNRCYCPGDQGRQASEDDSDFIEWFGEDFGTQPETIGSKCSGSGLFDVGPCKYGSPLVTSWPHFLDVQPKDDFRLQFVQGLNPDPEKHNFYMDIQPIMGMGLSAHVRLQLNLRMEKSPALPELMNLPIHDDAKSGILVPIMWFDDSIEEPPEDLMVLLKDALATGPSLSQASLVMSLISLIGQQVIFCTFILWSYHRHSPTFPDVD
jgi:scavenger receptor class B protein 1